MLKLKPWQSTVTILALAALGTCVFLKRANAAFTCDLNRPEVVQALEYTASQYVYENFLVHGMHTLTTTQNLTVLGGLDYEAKVGSNYNQASNRLSVNANFHTEDGGHFSLRLANLSSRSGSEPFDLQVNVPNSEVLKKLPGQTSRTCIYRLINPNFAEARGAIVAVDYQVGRSASRVYATGSGFHYIDLPVEVPSHSY